MLTLKLGSPVTNHALNGKLVSLDDAASELDKQSFSPYLGYIGIFHALTRTLEYFVILVPQIPKNTKIKRTYGVPIRNTRNNTCL